MSGLESRLQGSGDPHTEHAGIYLPGAIFRWRLSVGALAAYDLFCDRVLRDGSIAVIE